MKIFENIKINITPKSFTFYALFLSYGIFLLWFTIPGTITTLSHIFNPLSLPEPQAGLMSDILSEHNYIEELIFTKLPQLFAGIILIIVYIEYIFSKKYARLIGIIGNFVYLVYPTYTFLNNWQDVSFSFGTFQSILFYFLPPFTLIILTLVYWKKLGPNLEIKRKSTGLKFSFRKYSFIALFLTLGLISFVNVYPILSVIVQYGFSLWNSEQQLFVVIYTISSFISMVFLLIAYHGFLYSKKYTIHIGLTGCIFFIIGYISQYIFIDISIILILRLVFYISPALLLVALSIIYWNKIE